LKPDGEIVSEAHDNDDAARLVASPPVDPQVEDVVGSPRGFSLVDNPGVRCRRSSALDVFRGRDLLVLGRAVCRSTP
jgi:hypothetical protein